jgi:outer membrane protein assembly factor BamB
MLQSMNILQSGWLAGAILAGGCVLAAEEGWPRFRGPRGDGSSSARELPLYWSETNNVRWKVAIPDAGWSSPAVADDRIWLTSATADGRVFSAYCVEAASGRILHALPLFRCAAPEPLGNSVNGYASPSPAVGSGRVYAHFGSYGTACLDAASGRELWRREDLACRHYRGPGSSVILHHDLLILTFDGVDQQYVTALDARSGKTVWRTDRAIAWKDLDESGKPKREGDFRKGFATPIVIEANGRQQLISAASSTLFAYDPDSGKELWRVTNSAHTPAVSPIFADGRVLAVTGHGAAELLGVRPDGSGDVTASHVAWRVGGKDVPLTASPVACGGLLYTVSDHGALTCYETATGRSVWRQMVGGNYQASLLCAGDRVYCFGVSGKTTVLRAGSRTFEKLADNRLGTGFMASPAVLGNELILRTKTHLYRISN